MRLASLTRTARAMALGLGLAATALPALAQQTGQGAGPSADRTEQAQTQTPPLPRPAPRVIWRDAPQPWHRDQGGRRSDLRGDADFNARLEAARRGLDDSAFFPPPDGLWYYDWDSGLYYFERDGRWYVHGEQRGWYDRHGNYIPEGAAPWPGGRILRADPPRHRGPCACEGW